MTTHLTRQQHSEAADALIAWFKSQDIMPSDAGIIMLGVIAEQLVAKNGRDIVLLEKAITANTALLALFIAEFAKAYK